MLCGQINLQKGNAGASNLKEYLSAKLQTGNQSTNAGQPAEVERLQKPCAFLICLQEPPVREFSVTGFGRQHQLFQGRQNKRPRAAIYASSNLHLWLVPEFTSADLVTCIWKLQGGKEYYVASAYLDITNHEVIDKKLSDLLEFCSRGDKELLLCADTNAHSSLWNSPDTNPRGEKMEEMIFKFNLSVQNEGSHFTFFRGSARTIVDVTMTMGANVGAAISDWRVSDEVQGSDHLLLEWRIPISRPGYRKIRDMNKGDWFLFQESLEAERSDDTGQNYWTPLRLDEEALKLQKDIEKALDQSHPVQWRRPRIKVHPTFTDELTRWKKKVHACYSNYRQRRSEFAFEQLKDARRKYKNVLKRLRRLSWQNFTEEADDPKKAANFFKIIKGSSAQTLGMIKNQNGVPCATPEDSVQVMVDTHFPGNTNTNDASPPSGPICWDLEDEQAKFITVERTTEAIKSFGDTKAAGPDGIQPCVLKHLGPLALTRLCDLFKASYLLGYVPKVWRHSKVIFIPKQGKDDYAQARSFRPITLSSFVMKTMERLVYWHVNETHLLERPLSVNQHAFQRGKSTESALTGLVSKIEGALEKEGYALGVFLDIQGAFDNVSAPAIVKGMEAKHFSQKTIDWYEHYLRNRSMVTSINGISVTRNLTKGTPQGGVLSPLMWNLAFESFLALYDHSHVKPTGFADDAALLTTGKNPHTLREHMQCAVDKALEWGRQNGLTFSHAKTVMVLFGKPKNLPQIRPILMNGHTILPVEEVKYLGIILHRRLSWKPHIQGKIKQAKKLLLCARNATGKLWGCNPKMTRWIFTGIIRPAITYGALVWAGGCQNSIMRRHLERVNRLALLFMGSFRRSTPTGGLEVMLYVEPLHIHILNEACQALRRTAVMKSDVDSNRRLDLTIKNGHRQLCWSTIDKLELKVEETDSIKAALCWENKFGVDERSFQSGEPPNPERISTDMAVYTDGSGIDEAFGSGLIIFNGEAHPGNIAFEEANHLGEDSSVFQGEVHAILRAAKWMQVHQTGKNTIICSDSRAAIGALARVRTTSKLVLDTKLALNAAARDNRITIMWIKAHKGYFGNEMADERARKGAQDPALIPIDRPLIPDCMIKLRFKRGFNKLWQQYWLSRPDCRQTKLWMPEISKKHSFELLRLTRKQLSVMVQLITGHNFMKRHEALVNSNDDSECRLCLEDDETSIHVIAECPALAEARLRCFGQAFRTTPLQWTSKEVASFISEASIGFLLDPTDLLGLSG